MRTWKTFWCHWKRSGFELQLIFEVLHLILEIKFHMDQKTIAVNQM